VPLSIWHAKKDRTVGVDFRVLGVPTEIAVARPANTDTLQQDFIGFRDTFVAQLAKSVREWKIAVRRWSLRATRSTRQITGNESNSARSKRLRYVLDINITIVHFAEHVSGPRAGEPVMQRVEQWIV
jgi:hypothetical protein